MSIIKSVPSLLPHTSVNYLASVLTVQSQLHRSTVFVNSWYLTDRYVNVGYLRPKGLSLVSTSIVRLQVFPASVGHLYADLVSALQYSGGEQRLLT